MKLVLLQKRINKKQRKYIDVDFVKSQNDFKNNTLITKQFIIWFILVMFAFSLRVIYLLMKGV